MEAHEVLSIISGILFVLAFVPYLRAIWHDRHKNPNDQDAAKPAKASWLIWASLDSITLVGMAFAHSLNGQIVGAVAGAWLVAAAAFVYGKRGWKPLDLFCIVCALIGIALWQWSGNPVVSIVASNVAIFIAAFPTFENGWARPASEDKVAWTIFWLSCVCAVIAIPNWTLADAMQPIAFFVIESVMMILLFVRPALVRR